MVDFIKWIFSDLWIFLGFAVIISGIGQFIIVVINRVLRHKTISKHGYPPPYCDADGDIMEDEKEEE